MNFTKSYIFTHTLCVHARSCTSACMHMRAHIYTSTHTHIALHLLVDTVSYTPPFNYSRTV